MGGPLRLNNSSSAVPQLRRERRLILTERPGFLAMLQRIAGNGIRTMIVESIQAMNRQR
jgi:hypothetical protein